MLTRLSLVSLLLLTSAAGAAQESGMPEASATELSPYNARIEEAIRAQMNGDFTSARRLFAEAHALDANARTLRGMGVAAFEAGDMPQAVTDLSASLAHPNKPLDPELRIAVLALLNEAQARLEPHQAATAEPTAAQIPASETAPPENESPLRPDASALPSLTLPAMDVATHATRATTRASLSTFLAGSVLLLGSGALWLTGTLRVVRIQDACGSSCTQAFVDRETERAGLARLETGVSVMAGSAAVFLGSSLALFLWDRRSRKRAATLSLGPQSFGYTARF